MYVLSFCQGVYYGSKKQEIPTGVTDRSQRQAHNDKNRCDDIWTILTGKHFDPEIESNAKCHNRIG